MKNKIDFEGVSIDEILSLPEDELDDLIFCNSSIVFNAGSAEILGKFSIDKSKLVLELAQIDGGGEGVLPSISSLAHKIALQRNLEFIEWIVHAVNCHDPNLKLRYILDKRGFKVREMPNIGSIYYQLQKISD
ncbi:MAG: hypothetical protein RIE52_01860 [Balneola sp.]|jgi:hypothetical protein